MPLPQTTLNRMHQLPRISDEVMENIYFFFLNGKWREVVRSSFSRIRFLRKTEITQIHTEMSGESSKTTIDIAPIDTERQ